MVRHFQKPSPFHRWENMTIDHHHSIATKSWPLLQSTHTPTFLIYTTDMSLAAVTTATISSGVVYAMEQSLTLQPLAAGYTTGMNPLLSRRKPYYAAPRPYLQLFSQRVHYHHCSSAAGYSRLLHQIWNWNWHAGSMDWIIINNQRFRIVYCGWSSKIRYGKSFPSSSLWPPYNKLFSKIIK